MRGFPASRPPGFPACRQQAASCPPTESLHAESSRPESADLVRELIARAEDYDERFPPTV